MKTPRNLKQAIENGYIINKLYEKEKKKVLQNFSKYCFATKKAQKQMFHNLVNNYG